MQKLLQNRKPFVSTRARRNLGELTRDHHVVLVVGVSGSGKSVTCYDTLASFVERDRRKNEVHVINDFATLELTNIRSNMMILFDDCFEKWFYLPRKEASDQMMIVDVLQKIQELKNTCLLFTIRTFTTYVFRSTLQFMFGLNMPVIDFEARDNRLYSDEAYSILSVYVDYHGTAFYSGRKDVERKSLKENKDMMLKIAKNSARFLSTIGKVEALEIMCLKFESFHKEERFFQNPLEHMKKEIRRMKDSSSLGDKWEFCSLMYVLLKGGCVSSSIPEFSLFSKITRVFNTDLRKSNFSSIHSSFLNEIGGKIMLQHPCIARALLNFVFDGGATFMVFFLTNCDINILLRYFRFNESCMQDERDVFIFRKGILTVDYAPRIAERFATVYASTKDDNIVNHINMRDQRFKQIFDSKLAQYST